MLGLTFVLDKATERACRYGGSDIGFEVIRVVDRTLFRTRHSTVENWTPRWTGDKGPHAMETYDYMLHCVCRKDVQSGAALNASKDTSPGDEYCEILERSLQEEVERGFYTLAPGCFEVIPADLKV